MPAIRLSAPLGAKHAIDLDAGRIDGDKSGEIERFYGAQIRFLRSELRSEAARAIGWPAPSRCRSPSSMERATSSGASPPRS